MKNNSGNYVYENIIPKTGNFDSTNIIFKDSNDILNNEHRRKVIGFAKKIHGISFLASFMFYIIIVINLAELSILKNNKLINTNREINYKRGKILDRNGEIIATTINTKDLYLDTKKSLNYVKLIEKLSSIFEDKKEDYFKAIFKKKQYIRVKKDLNLEEINSLMKIGDPAIKFHDSKKRIYLQHNLFSHLTGFKSLHLKSKLEKNLNDKLAKGINIDLTVDLKIQTIVHEELKKSIKKYNAKSGVAIVMNVENGEIISLVSLPDFDPNFPENIKPLSENNLATEARYEMGSTLKIFNAALVYENLNNTNLVKEEFDISNGYQITSKKLIEDKHIVEKKIDFNEIFIHSSNVGSIKLIESIGIEKQKDFFEKIGITSKLKIDGLKIVNNKPPIYWDEQASKFISYGYGISISPISLISAYSSLVNGGFKINPVIHKNQKKVKIKIIDDQVSKNISLLLEKIVKEGTGKKARVNGLAVGGKTATSKKLEKGEYSEKKLITSFIGIFPVEEPKFISLILFDEPTKNAGISIENFGGNTAAPTFSRIVRKISPILLKHNYLSVK